VRESLFTKCLLHSRLHYEIAILLSRRAASRARENNVLPPTRERRETDRGEGETTRVRLASGRAGMRTVEKFR